MQPSLPFENLYNTRDLGGLPARGGRTIRSGMLLRSGYLLRGAAHDRKVLSALLSDAVDLRTDSERAELPDPPLAGVRAHHIPIVASLTPGVTHESGADKLALRRMTQDAALAKRYMSRLYEAFVTEPFCVAQYAKFLRLLAQERSGALLWHCTAGKDRAGFAAVIVEELLGVDRADIRADYLRTNDCLDPEIRARLAASDAPEALPYLFCAHEEYFDAACGAVERLGVFDAFLEQGLGVDRTMRARLRERYLE